jgi:8-oxo-dGTP pyrophosphatase MutT (NUDIX family)
MREVLPMRDAAVRQSLTLQVEARMKQNCSDKVVQAGGVVVKRKGGRVRVLVIRSNDGARWLFPKGHVEAGESAAQAATREVREEAGVDGAIQRFVGRDRYTRGSRRVEVSYYLLEYRGDVAPSENREARWCTPGQAGRLLAFEDLKTVLDSALSAV